MMGLMNQLHILKGIEMKKFEMHIRALTRIYSSRDKRTTYTVTKIRNSLLYAIGEELSPTLVQTLIETNDWDVWIS